MKKLFKKFLAGAISLALVATMGFAVSNIYDVKAANELSIAKWTFMQGGVFQNEEHKQETVDGNVYYLGSVTMNGTGETLTGWGRDDGTHVGPQACSNQTMTATQDSDGFVMDIAASGWDRAWGSSTTPKESNPWGFSATTKTNINDQHRYKVTFKAKCDSTKYGFLALETVVDGHTMTPWDGESGNPLDEGNTYFKMTSVEREYTIVFKNAVGGSDLSAEFRFGTFISENGKAYGYGGADISDVVTSSDNGYTGDVSISNFKIEDLDPDLPTNTTEPPLYTTTQVAPTVAPQPTQAPTVKPSPAPSKVLAKVTGVKVKNTKKKTIKVSWKKVANAKKYEIKVGNKTYKATKNSKKIKNKKFKKGKKVKVKVRATATGYTTGAWSKTVKKKLTK